MRVLIAFLFLLMTAPALADAAHSEPACQEDARLAAVFQRMHLRGTLVVVEPRVSCHAHDLARAAQALPPASTFKIFNALTALETGVIRDEHEVIAWDGVTREYPNWNRDHDLASGMQYSVLWYYQALARRIGMARMQEWIDKVGYGNRDISSGIDRFWLGGSLRISALQQIAFLQRLHDGSLPFSTRSQEIVRRILVRDQNPHYTLRFKTGYSVASKPYLGWIVGWLEQDGRVAYFALNMDIADDSMLEQRETALRAGLAALGYLGE